MSSTLWQQVKEYAGVSDGNEFVNSAEIALRDRLTSPFYGYFIAAWLIFNWRIIYAAFFLDQTKIFEKTGLLRNEYIQTLIPAPYTWDLFFRFLAEPLVLSVLMLWVFPYGTRIFYRKNLRNKRRLKQIELHELSKETRQETVLAKEETALIESEIEKAKVEKLAAEENPEILWEQEFGKLLRNHSQRDRLNDLQRQTYSEDRKMYDAEKQRLSYLHLIGLFNFKASGFGIELTDKGKYFLRRYAEALSENPKLEPF